MSKIDYPTIPAGLDELPGALRDLIASVSDPEVAYGANTDPYGKCVEVMWRAGYIAHELLAKELGVTGFQHSMSSLMLLAALRRMEGPFRIVDGENALYPQYDLVESTKEWLGTDDVRSWLADEAEKKLAEFAARTEPHAADRVIEHWRALVAQRPKTEEGA